MDKSKYQGNIPGTSLEVDTSGIATIRLQNPPVNALHPKGAYDNNSGMCGAYYAYFVYDFVSF